MRFELIIISFIVLFSGCKKVFFEEGPRNTPEENFEIFWKDFDMYYAQFDIRKVDWDSVYHVYRPRITNSTSDPELYNVLSEIVRSLNDGHVNLYTPLGNAFCQSCLFDYPSNKLINPSEYIVFGPSQDYSEIIEYRDVLHHNIGYIMLKSFTGTGQGLTFVDERYLIIDEILQEFQDKDGIIIDVRMNGGGNSANAEAIASRFADQERLYHRYYQKNGPGKNDFSDWYDRYVQPQGNLRYQKPVVVLTSRNTFSSAEIFVMAMQVFPHVTIVGDTTGGGIGNPIFRELPNGWTYRLSTKVGATADSYIIEGKGIPPDVPILTTNEDFINGVDRILEKGIGLIENIGE